MAGTGCFRVGSETGALRDAAFENGVEGAHAKFELGAGFFTVGLAKFAAKYVDIPPEARLALESVQGAECGVYNLERPPEQLASILEDADRAMERRGCERLVGVIQARQLVAVYLPRKLPSARHAQASILVLTDKQLVCATARADARDLIRLAMNRISQELPPAQAH